MKYNQGMGDEISHVVLLLFLGVMFQGFLFTSMWVCFAHGEGYAKLLALPSLALALFWGYFTAVIFNMMPALSLTEEGVHVRVLFVKRFWNWNDISQAGILWRRKKYGYYNDFVLLRKGGSPRRYRDKTFVLRNQFKLIHLPVTEGVRRFVNRHYGPLDFDLFDGRFEQSVVVDRLPVANPFIWLTVAFQEKG